MANGPTTAPSTRIISIPINHHDISPLFINGNNVRDVNTHPVPIHAHTILLSFVIPRYTCLLPLQALTAYSMLWHERHRISPMAPVMPFDKAFYGLY